MSTIDDRIDALYELPLSEFTAARNALAKSLTGTDRARVKALQKPTTVAWTVNLLYWRERKTFDRLLRAGQALRAAQVAALKGRSADIRDATAKHRDALADAVSTARQLAAAGGSAPDPEALSRMLEALSVSAAQGDHPGRWTEAVQPAGFEALAGITPVFHPRPADEGAGHAARRTTGKPRDPHSPPSDRDLRQHPRTARSPTTDERAAEKRRLDAQAARRKEAEAAVRSAKQEVDRAAAAEARADALVEQARQQLAHAESDRRAAGERTAKARRALAQAESALAKTEG